MSFPLDLEVADTTLGSVLSAYLDKHVFLAGGMVFGEFVWATRFMPLLSRAPGRAISSLDVWFPNETSSFLPGFTCRSTGKREKAVVALGWLTFVGRHLPVRIFTTPSFPPPVFTADLYVLVAGQLRRLALSRKRPFFALVNTVPSTFSLTDAFSSEARRDPDGLEARACALYDCGLRIERKRFCFSASSRLLSRQELLDLISRKRTGRPEKRTVRWA